MPLSEKTLLELYKVTVEEQRRQDDDHRRNAQVLLGVLTALIGVIGYLYDKQDGARPLILIVGGLFVFVLAFLGWWAHIHDYERVHKTVSVRAKLEGDLGMESPVVREGASRWPSDPYIHPGDREARDKAKPEGADSWYAELICQRWWKCWQSWLFYFFMTAGLVAIIWGVREGPLIVCSKALLGVLAGLMALTLFLRIFPCLRRLCLWLFRAFEKLWFCVQIVLILLIIAVCTWAAATRMWGLRGVEMRIILTALIVIIMACLFLAWYAREKRKAERTEEKNELRKQASEAAEKIWRALKKASDSMTKNKLAEKTGLNGEALNLGVGWLARGGKIEYGSGTDTLKLKD